ncbi:MAG: hypothetical protein MK212_18395 [Saprospiraceae bacterium]|nr:hypothetical protein [Saprospiraceae bacterium]
MQKVVIFLGTFLGSILFANAQFSEKKTDLELMGLSGQVKSLLTTHYEPEPIDGNWVIGEPYREFDMVFNEHGNIVKEDWHEIMRGIKKTFTNIDYTYDNEQNIVNKVTKNSKKIVKKISKYEYNSKGQQTARKDYDKEEQLQLSYEYTLDDKGNIIVSKRYDAEDKSTITIKYEYEYDSEDQIIEKKMYKEGRFSGYETFKYDEKGMLTKHMRFTPDGRPIGGELNKYDQHGNNIEKVKVDNTYGGEKKTYTIKLTYDEQNNWIERWEYEEETPIYITKRRINMQ